MLWSGTDLRKYVVKGRKGEITQKKICLPIDGKLMFFKLPLNNFNVRLSPDF